MRWSQEWDLHSHTVNSDGMHDEQTVATMMKNEGVRYWSLTDHDTTSGWIESAKACTNIGMIFIPGIEITCKPGLPMNIEYMQKMGLKNAKTSWHLLAYFPKESVNQTTMQEIEDWLSPFKSNRVSRMISMLERLEEFDMKILLEEVSSYAKDTIGRPHLAKAMLAKGYVDSVDEAFDNWIGDGKPAHVENEQPSIQDAVTMVKKFGGITSLAHPVNYGVETEKLLPYLKNVQVDAIEAFHRSHDSKYRHELLNASRNIGIGVTTGSDFHGTDHNFNAGRALVPISDLPEFFTQFRDV